MSKPYNYIDFLIAEDFGGAEEQDELDEFPYDELYNAEIAFYDACNHGNHRDWINATEELLKAIERRYNLAEVPCGICHRTECSHQ
jgi:hypothetical protein